MSTNFRIESGIQLLTRLTKKSSLEHFYPKIFGNGPQFGDFIEIYSEHSITCILVDLICEALIHSELNGTDGSIIVFDTGGNLDFDYFIKILRKKLETQLTTSNNNCFNNQLINLDSLINSTVKRVDIQNIYEPAQYYVSIQNLENVLMKHPNVTLLVFDTITAFYWSEQNFKIAKMDTYLKDTLDLIKKSIKDFKVTVLYTRPKYFCSNKDIVENLRSCSKDSADLQNKYKIEVVYNECEPHDVVVYKHKTKLDLKFCIENEGIVWL